MVDNTNGHTKLPNPILKWNTMKKNFVLDRANLRAYKLSGAQDPLTFLSKIDAAHGSHIIDVIVTSGILKRIITKNIRRELSRFARAHVPKSGSDKRLILVANFGHYFRNGLVRNGRSARL